MNIDTAAEAELTLEDRVAARFEASQDKAAPEQVDRYFKEVKKDNPSYDDSQAWATAWSIYCAHKNPSSPSCHQDSYFPGKKASAPDWKEVAEKLLEARKGNDEDDLHYRAYMRAVMAGLPTKHLVQKFKGAKEAQADLIDEAGKAPKTADDKTADDKSKVRNWMRSHAHEYEDKRTGEVNATELAEAAADEFGHKDVGDWLDDETHWVWDLAADAAEQHERQHKHASLDSIESAVADRWAMEFPSEEALRNYLKEHPKAKARNHKVKKPKHDDAAEPADRKEIDRASKAADAMSKLMEQVLGEADRDPGEKGRDLAGLMEDFEDSVDAMAKGINHIPAGKDRDRAKKIHQQISEVVEGLNDSSGYRWKGKGRNTKRFLNPEYVTDAHKKMKPLVAELDKLLSGQRVLLASESLEQELQKAIKWLDDHGKRGKGVNLLHTALDHLRRKKPGAEESVREILDDAIEAYDIPRSKTSSVALSDLNDPLYNTQVKLPKYNIRTTVTQAHGGRDKARVLIQLAPQMTKSQHAQRARDFLALAERLEKDWDVEAEAAAQETWGRSFEVGDYRVSGIASYDFSKERKDKLRTLAQGSSKAKEIAEGHEYAAKSRQLQDKTAGFSYGMAPLSVLFVDGKKPAPFNIDTIRDINHTTIEVIGDDGEQHDVNLKFVRQESSGPLTQPQEKLGWKRETRVDIMHPVDEGVSPASSARAAMAALVQLGKRHGFTVEPVKSSYQPQTRKASIVEAAAPVPEAPDAEDGWQPGQKRNEWNLSIYKYSPSRWSYYLTNPSGGGSGSSSYPSFKAAFAAGTQGVAWGEEAVNPGKKKVWVMEQTWDPEAEAYKVTKSYWWNIPEELLQRKFK